MAFVKGKSGNPSGRPKAYTLSEIRDIARKAAPEMVAVLIDIATDEDQAAAARATAANHVLDRGYGKPAQTIADEDGNTMSWFDLLASAQRRANIIDAPAKLLANDVN